MAAALLARAELTTLKPRLAGGYRREYVDAVIKLLKEAIEGVNEAEAKERS
jgi:hypothetical protein